MAMDFIRALATEGHQVNRVFFYHDGVREGFGDSVSAWSELAQGGQFELILCSQALDQRGLAPDVERPFVVGGLGLWVDACLKADRVLTFGAPCDEV
jgi:tRNA 2-thiouridine synthesizing protein D